MISNQKTTKKGRNVVCNNSRGRPRTREAYSIPSLLVLPSHSGLKNKKNQKIHLRKEHTAVYLSPKMKIIINPQKKVILFFF